MSGVQRVRNLGLDSVVFEHLEVGLMVDLDFGRKTSDLEVALDSVAFGVDFAALVHPEVGFYLTVAENLEVAVGSVHFGIG